MTLLKEPAMKQEMRTNIRIAEGGRIVIPTKVRRRLGLDIGDSLVLSVEDDRATIMNPRAARQRARQRVRRYVKPGVNLGDELMAERKKESARE